MNALARRRLMMMLGGNAEMLGELSKYQKITNFTVLDSSNISFNHTLGMIPKLILVNADTEGDESTIIKHVFLDQHCGASVTGSNAVTGYTVRVDYEGSIGNSNAKMNDTSVEIRRTTATRYFDVNDTYTIELYA